MFSPKQNRSLSFSSVLGLINGLGIYLHFNDFVKSTLRYNYYIVSKHVSSGGIISALLLLLGYMAVPRS